MEGKFSDAEGEESDLDNNSDNEREDANKDNDGKCCVISKILAITLTMKVITMATTQDDSPNKQ